MRSLNDPKGLTFIEVMLGLAISAVIFALVLGAMRLGQRSQEKGLERQDLAQRMRIISDRLGWLVRGAYPYVYTDPEDPESRELFFSGDKGSLGFVTTATDPYSESSQDLSGLKYVVMSLDENALILEEQVFYLGGEDIPKESRFILDSHVSALEFSYFDPVIDEEGARGEPEWVDKWDGTDLTYLPLAVQIKVKLKRGEEEIELPPVVAAIRSVGPSISSTASDTPESGPPQGGGPQIPRRGP